MADSIRVLHVDDEPRFSDRTAAFLEREDDRITVDTATTASEGLDRIAENGYDCIVSEYEMPGTNGIEFLEAVRRGRPGLPFVLFTDSGSEEIASEAITAGVTDYLQKGSDNDQYEQLLTRIDDAVSTNRIRLTNTEVEGEFRGYQSLLSNVIEQIPTHMYVKDREARHLWVSGYDVNDDDSIPDSEEHIGKTDLELYPEELSRESYRDDLRVIGTGEPLIGKVEYEPAADEWILSNKVPWYDERGDIVGLIGVTRRITRRKEYEQRLERQNERLDEFVSLVSHDLRTPLTVACAYLELAQEEYDSPHLDEVAVALDRMERLIQELLTLAREGKQAVDLGPASLPTLADCCWDDVATADAALATETSRVIRADDGRLKQLFENLFRNAVEHAGDDVTVTVGELDAVSESSERRSPSHRSSGRSRPKGEATEGSPDSSVGGFYVEDDGPGIPEDERETIFERGYSTAKKGTGFGLSIVEKVVETHGWDIDVTDGDAGGARFEITSVEFVE